MGALSLRLPNSLHARARELAERDGISINQLVASALAEKMSALLTEEYLEASARRGARARFVAALARVPPVAPDPGDVLPAQRNRGAEPVRSRRRKPKTVGSRARVRG